MSRLRKILAEEGISKKGATRSVVILESHRSDGLVVTFYEFLPKGQVPLSVLEAAGLKFLQDTRKTIRQIGSGVTGLAYPMQPGQRDDVWVEGDGKKNVLLRTGYLFEYSASGLEHAESVRDMDREDFDLALAELKAGVKLLGWQAK